VLIIDDTNWQTQIGDGKTVSCDGVDRMLAALPKPAGHDSRAYSKPFGAVIPKIPRSEWSARIKEKQTTKSQISDHQNWPCDNQGSYPTCWAAGTVQAYSTARVLQMGIANWRRISAMSLAVPISGGNSGGYEGEAVKYLHDHGGVDAELWGYTDRSRKDGDPAIQANRARNKALESYECDGFDDFATALLLDFPCTVHYSWWSHVVMLCDLVEIEAGSFGFRIRNNWGDGYGDKNSFGHGGYAVFREGRGTPGGGYAFRQVTPSTAN